MGGVMPWWGIERHGWAGGGGWGEQERAGWRAVVGHRAPRVVARRWLGEPDVAGVACELAALARRDDRVAVADLAARGVDQIGAPLHLRQQLRVEQVFR